MPEIILDTYMGNRILAEIRKAIGVFVLTYNPHNRMNFTHLFADDSTRKDMGSEQ